MSNFSGENSYSGGRKLGKLPEKSNFAQTCQLLSQFLKEKRSFGITQRMEPNDGFPATRPPIMNLLTNLENSEENLSKSEQQSPAPMTIFYGGKVLVFNDLSSETAEEIMAMAGKEISSSFRSDATVSEKVMEPVTGNGSNLAGEQPLLQTQTKVSGDLPIARRASLHRFFEKRKDRVAAKAPYQVNPQRHSVSSKAGESFRFNNGKEKAMDELSKHFDLNL